MPSPRLMSLQNLYDSQLTSYAYGTSVCSAFLSGGAEVARGLVFWLAVGMMTLALYDTLILLDRCGVYVTMTNVHDTLHACL